jgi:ribosomal protein S18 acetylase RimI-like enzyme
VNPMPAGGAAIDIALIDADEFGELVDAAADVYGAAMQRGGDMVVQRRDIMAGHVDRRGFVAAVAREDDALVGFGYGYHGRPGEWWHDVVAAALGREAARTWLSEAFELAELHVDPDRQGVGVGRQLIDTLLGATSRPTVVLSTHDRESPARSLYRSVGFVDLLRDFRFPGSSEVYAVLGLQLRP